MDGVLVALYQYCKQIDPDLVDFVDKDKIFSIIGRLTPWGLYRNLPEMFDFKEAFRFLNELFAKGYDVQILSSCTKEPYSNIIEQDKNLWLDDRNVRYPRNFVRGSKEKRLFARKGAVLIDDYFGAGKPFEEAGGIWIPHKNWYLTIPQVEDAIAKLENE